jgi:nucleoside-diphosphate-sugar epimerase
MSAESSVVVTGASSQIGVFLLPQLAEAGYEVTAVSRSVVAAAPRSDAGVCWIPPDTDPGSARYLVSCGPLPLALPFVERAVAPEKVVAFGTTSTLSKSDSPDRAERETIAAIADAEAGLKARCRERDIDLVLIRPTLVYGCGRDENLSRLLRFGERTGFIPVSTRSSGLRQPVHAQDLAGLALRALQEGTGSLLEGEACGGSKVSYREMVARTAQCGRRKIRVLHIPAWLFKTLAGLAPGANPAMVARQARDLVFDDSGFRQRLDWNPRPFEPTPADFAAPPKL